MVTLPPVSIVGLGKLGASMAAAIASRGGTVVGVDLDQSSSMPSTPDGRRWQEHQPRVDARLEHVADPRDARCRAGAFIRPTITFVIVPTPGDERGVALDGQVAHGVPRASGTRSPPSRRTTSSCSRARSSRSTTRRGSAAHPRTRIGQGARALDFGLCYSPEFIGHGTAIRDFLNPDFTLDRRAGPAIRRLPRGLLRRDHGELAARACE